MPLLGEDHGFLVLLCQHYKAEKQYHISLADLRASSTPNAHQKKIFSTYGGNGGVACRRRAAKVASCGPFRNVFKPLNLDRHRFLEEWPHLQTKAKKERFQWLTAAFLNLAHDLFRQPDHYEEGDHRWQRLQCSLRECLHLSTRVSVHGSRNQTFV
jgi:hypothetical protein